MDEERRGGVPCAATACVRVRNTDVLFVVVALFLLYRRRRFSALSTMGGRRRSVVFARRPPPICVLFAMMTRMVRRSCGETCRRAAHTDKVASADGDDAATVRLLSSIVYNCVYVSLCAQLYSCQLCVVELCTVWVACGVADDWSQVCLLPCGGSARAKSASSGGWANNGY